MKTLILVLCLLLCPLSLWAQLYKINPDDTQRNQSFVLLRDGQVVKGQVLRQDSTIITVRRRGKELSFIEADQVVRITAVRPDLPASTVQVRSTGPYRVFVFKDGSQVEGMFVKRDSTMITVRKRNGQLTYFEPELLSRVDSVAVDTYADTSRLFPNRFFPWLLTGVTAHNPEKRQFYYRNTWLLLNEFDYGITRHWSIGASFITPIPYLVLADGFYATGGQYFTNNSRLFTKLSAPIGKRFRLATNVTYRTNQILELFNAQNVWTFQALATIGSTQRNVTLGYGLTTSSRRVYYYGSSPWSSAAPLTYSDRSPNYHFLSAGLVYKVLPGLTLISDNTVSLGRQYYYYDASRVSASFAFRIDRRRHAFDLGFSSRIYQKPYLYDGKSVRLVLYAGYNLMLGRS